MSVKGAKVIILAGALGFAPFSIISLYAQDYDEDSPVELIEGESGEEKNTEKAEKIVEAVPEQKNKKSKKSRKVKKNKKTFRKKKEIDPSNTDQPPVTTAKEKKEIDEGERKENPEENDFQGEGDLTKIPSFRAAPEHPDFLYDTRSIPGIKDYDSWSLASESNKVSSEPVTELSSPVKSGDFKFKMPEINFTQVLVIGGALLLFILYQIQIRKKMRNRR